MKKEILILGTICLFIGVGIQPAFAIEISNDRPSENIEDCNCQVSDDYDIVRVKSLLNRAERSLNRVEICTKLITTFYKDKPEVINDCEELSIEIKNLSMMVDELTIALSGQDYPIFCAILEAMLNATGKIGDVVYDILDLLYIIFHFIPIILDGCFTLLLIFTVCIIIDLQVEYECIEVPIEHRKILYQKTKELK